MRGRPRRRAAGVAIVSILALAWVGRVTAGPGDGKDWAKKANAGRQAVEIGYSLPNAMQKITREDEYYLGRTVAAQILAEYPPVDDPTAGRYLSLVGHSLVLASKRPEGVFMGYRFVLLDSDEVDAFAAPGAFLFVTRGMVGLARDEDMLAAVLAHEIGHIQGHHGRRLIKEKHWKKFWNDVATAAVASWANKWAGRFGAVLGGMAESYYQVLYTRGYGRELDLEADRTAIEILERAGYDPHALIEVLRAVGEAAGPGRRGFARTHPKPEKRIRELLPLAPEPRERPSVRRQRFLEALGTRLEG